MCPDRQILSVYFDGELGSPWREKLEKHLEACPQCREQLEAYRALQQKLGASGALASIDPQRSMEKVWERSQYGFRSKQRLKKFWTGSVSIPLPVAAAAGLVMVLTLAALVSFRQPAKVSDPQLAGLEVQDMNVSDMASFFQYLGSENSPDMVIIRLPDTTFKNAGEPQMLRAADYSRSAASR